MRKALIHPLYKGSGPSPLKDEITLLLKKMNKPRRVSSKLTQNELGTPNEKSEFGKFPRNIESNTMAITMGIK